MYKVYAYGLSYIGYWSYTVYRLYNKVHEEIEEKNITNFFWVGGEVLIGINLINSSFKISNAPFFLIL